MSKDGGQPMWEHVAKYGLGGLICVLVGMMGGPALLAQTGNEIVPSSSVSPDVLEERLRGHQEAVIHRLDSMQAAQCDYIATVAQIAENTGEIRASVREQAFTIAAIQGQIADLRAMTEDLGERLNALEKRQ